MLIMVFHKVVVKRDQKDKTIHKKDPKQIKSKTKPKKICKKNTCKKWVRI